MAQFDFTVTELNTAAVDTRTFSTYAGNKALNQGEVVILDGSHAGYVTTGADSGAIDTDSTVVGVAATTSNHTASANGTVDVTVPATGRVLRVAFTAQTPANLTVAQKTLANPIAVSSGGVQTYNQGSTTKGLLRMESFDNTTNGKCVGDLICTYH